MFTEIEVKEALPRGARNIVTQDFVDKLNSFQDPGVAEAFRENFFSYSHILADGRYKLVDYANAVKFVSFRLMDLSITDSYKKVFHDKVQKFIASGYTNAEISSLASAYNKGKLVSTIFEKTLIPTHVLNADIHQQAINTLAGIMGDEEASNRAKIDAANGLLAALKAPETAKLEVDMKVSNNDAIKELQQATLALAQRQKDMLESGTYNAVEIAESQIIEGEAEPA